MQAHKISIKLFAQEGQELGAAEFVPVFHSWIQDQRVADHLLIDVADYDHVHHGPGTVLVSHEANFSTDKAGGRLGLLYLRKQPAPGTFRDRLRQALATTLRAAADLERDPRLSDRLRFRTDEIEVRIHDRLLAPNTPETIAAVKPEVEAVLSELYGQPVTVEPASQPIEMLTLRARVNFTARAEELAAKVPTAISV